MHLLPEEILEELYKYDRDLPLDAAESENPACPDNPAEIHVAFSGARDQRICSLLTLPRMGDPPYAAVVILHGVFGHKSSPNQLKRSAYLAQAGFATLRVDGQYCGERQKHALNGGIQGRYYYRNRDAIIQTVMDLMRGVDYLSTRRDIDTGRIGFAGFSMGGAVGAIFCAYEQRVKAIVLGITGGDFSKLNVSAPDVQTADRMLRAYSIVDPIHYVGRISPRPLLMQNASRDFIISRASTEALFEAARQPKKILWYDCGHADLPDKCLEDMAGFFGENLK
jgi:cephalosporin-C deacetylase-like acetyl esterase